MLKWLILIALLFTGFIYLTLNEVGAAENKGGLVLQEPIYQWVPCTCSNKNDPNWPPVLGLNENDFIKHQMWIVGLKHQAGRSKKYKQKGYRYTWQWRASCKKTQSKGNTK